MASFSSKPITEVKHSKIKIKSTCKTVIVSEEPKDKICEKLRNLFIENITEPPKKI